MNKKYIPLMAAMALLTIMVIFSNPAKADLGDIIIKDGISVKLISNTDICDTQCNSTYEICYDSINILKDLRMDIFDTKDDLKQTLDYIEKLDIFNTGLPNCKQITVHGTKGIFENIDNVPCIKDVCFNEFAWWNSSWNLKQPINVTTSSDLTDFQIHIRINETNNGTDWNWTNECQGRFRILNSAETTQLPFWIEYCNVTSKELILWFKGNFTTANGTQAYIYYNNTATTNASNGTNTFLYFDDFSGTLADFQSKWTNGTCGQLSIDNQRLKWHTVGTACENVPYITSSSITVPVVIEMESNMTVDDGTWTGLHEAFVNSPSLMYQSGIDQTSSTALISRRTPGWDTTTDTYSTSLNTVYYRKFVIQTTTASFYSDTFRVPTSNRITKVADYTVFGASQAGLRLNKGTNVNNATGYIDNYKVRKFALVEPIASIGGQEIFTIEEQKASILGYQFGVTNFIVGSQTPTTFINISFNTSEPLTAIAPLFSANCQRVTGLTNFVTVDVYVDSIKTDSKRLCSVSAAGDITSGGILPETALLSVGQHNLRMDFNISTSGSVNISNIDLVTLKTQTNDNKLINGSKIVSSFNFSNTAYQEVFRFNASNITAGANQSIFASFSINASAEEIAYLYIQNNVSGHNFPLTSRYLSSSADVGSASMVFTDDTYTPPGITPYPYVVYAKTRNGNMVTVSAVFRTANLKDLGNNTIYHFFSTNASTNITNSIPLSAGWHNLITVPYTPVNGTNMTLSTYLTLNSTSGAQTVRMVVNNTKTAICSQKYRYLSADIDHGSIYAYFMCDNLTVGVQENFTLWLFVNAGESVTLLDEALSGTETVTFNISIGNLPPIPGDIINPEDNATVNGTNYAISWTPFIDPNLLPVTYNVSLYNKTGTLNDTIVSGTPLTTVNVNWTEYENGSYDLVVIGCDLTGLCSNATHNITINNLPVPPIPPITPFNASRTYCYNQDILSVLESHQNTTIIGSNISITTTETQRYVNCEYGCDYFNARCRDSPIVVLITFILFLVLLALSLVVPCMLITIQSRKRKLKFIRDMVILFITFMVYLVVYVQMPSIATYFTENLTIMVISVNLTMLIFYVVLLILFTNNVMKGRYS